MREQTFLMLMLSRIIIGIGSAIVYTVSFTYIGEIAPIDRRARFIALFQSSFFASGIVGSALGGLFSDFFNMRAIFFVSFLCSMIGVLFILLLKVREDYSVPDSVSQIRQDLFKGINIKIIALSISCFIMFLIDSSIRTTMIPLYGVSKLGLSPSQIGFVFSLISSITIIALLFITPRVEVIKKSTLLPISLLVASIAVILVSFSSDFISLSIFSVFIGISTGLLNPIPIAMLINYTNPRNRGVIMGFLRTIGDLGIVLGPILVGGLIDIGEPLFVFYLVALFSLIFSFFAYVIFKEKKPIRNGKIPTGIESSS